MKFAIRLDRRFLPWLVFFGVIGRRNAYVRLEREQLLVRFGFLSLRLPLAGIERVELQGPWRWWTAVGVRGTMGRPEVTFGGSAHGGVALFLHRPIKRWWWIRHLREVYFTLDQPDSFAAEMARRGIPGGDSRTGATSA